MCYCCAIAVSQSRQCHTRNSLLYRLQLCARLGWRLESNMVVNNSMSREETHPRTRLWRKPFRRMSESTLRLVGTCCVANLGGLLVGLHLALFSGILEMPSFSKAFPENDPTIKSLITSAMVFGAIVGAVPAGPFADRWGRRPALGLTALLFGVATILTVYSTTVIQLTAARIIAGFAYALATVVCPMYTAEMAPASTRGVLVNLYQLFITVGIFAAQLANASYWETGPWVSPLYFAFIPAVVMCLLVWLYLPESNVWLSSRHQVDVEGGKPSKSAFRDLLRDASAMRRLLIGTGLSASQQTTGINAVIFFGPALVSDVLHMKGSGGPFIAAAMVGAGNLLATVGSMFMIERFGRRQLLLAAGAPMVASLTILGLMRQGAIPANGSIGMGALLTFIMAFAVTYGPLPFVICSEIFPVRYKGIGMGLCGFTLMLFALIIGATFLPVLERVGGGVYFIYAVCVTFSSMFVWKFVPETKNLSLREIDELLDRT